VRTSFTGTCVLVYCNLSGMTLFHEPEMSQFSGSSVVPLPTSYGQVTVLCPAPLWESLIFSDTITQSE
jgi:hypothetical protein